MMGEDHMATATTRIRVVAERDGVALLWLEGARRAWVEVQEPEGEESLVAAVEPERALDAFYHPDAYLTRVDHARSCSLRRRSRDC
jgi:hypothetical protein